MPYPNRYQPMQANEQENDVLRLDAKKYMDMLIKEILRSIPSAIQNNHSILEGFKAYTANVENLEIVCMSNGWLGEEELTKYNEEINQLFPVKDKLEDSQQTRLSREKFKRLLKIVLDHQTKFESMEI